jgi:hypothetical protein
MRFAWPARSYTLLEAALEWERREPMTALAPFAINRVTMERFESYVLKGPGCWEWQGQRLPSGYGVLEFERRAYYAHRLAWMRLFGPIPDGIHVCHTCDNPPCCRDGHHFLGTAKQNTADARAKGRLTGPRLSPEDRDRLRALCVGASTARLVELAEEFGVSYHTVADHYARSANAAAKVSEAA